MKLSFKSFLSFIWWPVDLGTKALPHAPAWVQAAGYGTIRGIFWLAYYLPGAPLRRTANAFGRLTGHSGRTMFAGFAYRFTQALARMEALRLGRTDEIDRLLVIPDEARIQAIREAGTGLFLAVPHCHATALMARALGARYPVLLLVRNPADEFRAKKQDIYYAHLGVDSFDVRRAPEARVARAVFKALKAGHIVIGVSDRVLLPPLRKRDDASIVTVFGEEAGFPLWPARFASRCGAPILPCMVEQLDDRMVLHLGEAIPPADPAAMTQAMADGLTGLMLRFPFDWGFVYDKYWSKLVQAAASRRTGP